MALDSKIPGGPLADKWDRYRFESKLANPANRRKYTVLIVGTGLAGASAANPAVRDLYRTEIEVFHQPLWVAFYVICTALVALHLRHGISSGFQSIGFDHPIYTRRLVTWGIIGAIVIGGGLAVIPLIVYLTT